MFVQRGEHEGVPWAQRDSSAAYQLLVAARQGRAPQRPVERLALLQLLMQLHRQSHERTGDALRPHPSRLSFFLNQEKMHPAELIPAEMKDLPSFCLQNEKVCRRSQHIANFHGCLVFSCHSCLSALLQRLAVQSFLQWLPRHCIGTGGDPAGIPLPLLFTACKLSYAVASLPTHLERGSCQSLPPLRSTPS